MYNPWRALRALGDKVHLIWEALEPGVLAETDGEGAIWMDPDQYQSQLRCTLAHELAHIELGHTAGCSPYDERRADELAARRLIPMPRLLDALAWADDLHTVAEELHVDEQTLIARLDFMDDDERAQIMDLHERIGRPA